MKLNIIALNFLISLTTTGVGWSQTATIDFEILPGSTYTYHPSGEGPGIEGCSPNNYQCDFEIAGLFSLQINNNGSASIKNANLSLRGNEGVAGPGFTTAANLEGWLESEQLFNIAAIAISAAYRAETNEFTPNPLTLIYDTPGTGGTLVGGFDLRPVDGNGIHFHVNLRQVAVPEPTAVCLIGVLFAAIGSQRWRCC